MRHQVSAHLPPHLWQQLSISNEAAQHQQRRVHAIPCDHNHAPGRGDAPHEKTAREGLVLPGVRGCRRLSIGLAARLGIGFVSPGTEPTYTSNASPVRTCMPANSIWSELCRVAVCRRCVQHSHTAAQHAHTSQRTCAEATRNLYLSLCPSFQINLHV